MNRFILVAMLALSLAAPSLPTRSAGVGSTAVSEKDAIEVDRLIRERFGVLDDPALTQFVESVAGRLAGAVERDKTEYRAVILDTPLLNLFALPGGRLYVTRGALEWLNSEDELAALIAPEIAHRALGHPAERRADKIAASVLMTLAGAAADPRHADGVDDVAREAADLLVRGYSRTQDGEAEQTAKTYLVAAGYDPRAIERVHRTAATVRDLEPRRAAPYFKHRPWRAEAAADAVAGDRTSPDLADRDAYLARLEGLRTGDRDSEAFAFAGELINREHGLAARIPDGAVVLASGSAAARPLAGTAFASPLFLQHVVKSLADPLEHTSACVYGSFEVGLAQSDDTPDRLLEGFRRVAATWEAGSEVKTNGLAAGQAVFRASDLPAGMACKTKRTGGKGIVRIKGKDTAVEVRKGLLVRGGSAIELTVVAQDSDTEAGKLLFDRIYESIRELTAEERRRFPQPRLRVVQAGPGETWASLAADLGRTPTWLAAFNGFDGTTAVPEQHRVKIPLDLLAAEE